MFKIQCACGKQFNVPEKFAGRQGRCPSCHTIIQVPNTIADVPTFEESEPEMAPPPKRKYDAQELFETVIDSVVGISDDGRLYGSGVLISSDGMVATNRHVVGLAEKVKVQLNDGATVIGDLIRSYKDIDLAFLKIPVKDNHFATLAENGRLRIGQSLFAIGHPMGLQNTITKGIVSALNRKIDGMTYIQTDASINPGNSDGPLYDEYGEVVGINTLILRETQGLGFAIPVEVVRERYEAVQTDLRALYSKTYCGICGKNSEQVRYCEHCGVELDAGQPMLGAHMLKQTAVNFIGVQITQCDVCHSAMPVSEKYCQKCGATLQS